MLLSKPFLPEMHRRIFSMMMSSTFLLNTKPFLPPIGFQTHKRLHTPTVILCSNNNSTKPISSLKSWPIPYSTHTGAPPPVYLEGSTLTNESQRLSRLMTKLSELRIEGYEPVPGQHNHLSCPMCKGGDLGEKSLTLHISGDGNTGAWICFRSKCGWQGNTMAIADVAPTYGTSSQMIITKRKMLTEQSLRLEPLCDELHEWFAGRRISPCILKRNYVMQKRSGEKMAIAFTYRRNGSIVNCKYRDVNKKAFWQEQDTEKIFYGLDDIKNATDIIIVEGEMDKLAVEEAGFLNCVSVPNGAPSKVSKKELPPPDKDTKYDYLWHCKEYFDKASRIILATDGDRPGQALAEELARRIGRERCWRVKWPKKNEVDYFKDANEVLEFLGPESLKKTIEDAELYPIQGLFAFRDHNQ